MIFNKPRIIIVNQWLRVAFGLLISRIQGLLISRIQVHDLLRLPPFPLYGFAEFIVMLDITGLIFSWQHFAHWGHLGGFAAGGGVVGWYIFHYPRRRHMALLGAVTNWL